MTVKKLIEMLKKSADNEDIVLRQIANDKGTITFTEEISEITIKHYDDTPGYVELW